MELFSRIRWRVVWVQYTSKYAYCSSYSVSILKNNNSFRLEWFVLSSPSSEELHGWAISKEISKQKNFFMYFIPNFLVDQVSVFACAQISYWLQLLLRFTFANGHRHRALE